MCGSPAPAPAVHPADVFLDVDDLAERYRIGRSKAYALVAVDGFPASVVPGMWRIPLAVLRRWETHVALAATDVPTAPIPAHPRPVPAPPPARRPGRPRGGAA
ncbi:MAG TPA: helix-turn-helix domain-containing protein [Acidimicrobiales bacterium]|nr:helix-turn-helix domain-containing protein [Acidimicrobiales bacterium]